MTTTMNDYGCSLICCHLPISLPALFFFFSSGCIYLTLINVPTI